jgi:hypothetical protein
MGRSALLGRNLKTMHHDPSEIWKGGWVRRGYGQFRGGTKGGVSLFSGKRVGGELLFSARKKENNYIMVNLGTFGA